ncbi:hypothetical protein CEXT_477481 [Caerostris extrusa]|uniref:Uncharacterized protein n=1 Tax=Caerostris extrusa TaxID=172846 RepID=A0AAV4X7D5_CAEEX|nr:hypothetical protein CEXT_477481 [Caerostris extrusa]
MKKQIAEGIYNFYEFFKGYDLLKTISFFKTCSTRKIYSPTILKPIKQIKCIQTQHYWRRHYQHYLHCHEPANDASKSQSIIPRVPFDRGFVNSLFMQQSQKTSLTYERHLRLKVYWTCCWAMLKTSGIVLAW